jgi:IS5 family transposase
MILRWICQGKMKWFIGTRGYFGAKSKDYDAIMKRAVRGHTLGTKDILRNKRISLKEFQGNEYMQ